MRVGLSLLLVAVAALAFACDNGGGVEIKGSGVLVTRAYEFEDFTNVQLSHAFDADISYADTYSVEVEVDDNLVDRLDVKLDGDTLVLALDSPINFSNVTLNATVTMPDVQSLDLSGASRATVTGFENMDDLEATLSGASTLDGTLDVAHLDLRLSGASTASFDGGGIEADLDASGASTLDLDNFALEIALVTMSGASNGKVNVRDELGPVILSGVSHLTYAGSPALTGVDTSGASTLDPE